MSRDEILEDMTAVVATYKYTTLPLLGLTGCILLLTHSCSAPEPKDVEGSAVSTVTYVECDKASPLADEKKLTDSDIDHTNESTYSLQEATTPGYNDAIKTLVNSNCAFAGCHATGGTLPDLSTYALVKTNMARGKIRIELASSPMPPGSQLEATDQALFAAWVAADGPETDAAGGTTPSETPTATPTPAAPACFVKNEKRVALEDPEFDYLLRTAEVNDCHSKKLIYDRNAKACGTAALSLDWCTRIGILKKFADAKKDALSIVNKALGDGTSATDIGDGFIIDQCGMEPSGAPIAIFLRLVKPPEVPGLKVRVLAIDAAKKDTDVVAPETTTE